MKLIFILSVLFAQYVSAQSCNPPAIRRWPVIDQDGIGTCASASAALLIQQNVEDENGRQGLAQTPSYLQMGIYSAARSTTPGFFKSEPGGLPTFFNGYQMTCAVVDTAMTQGFCDSTNFPLDFLNREDPMNSQQLSLEMLGRYLQGHMPDLERFRASLRSNPDSTKDLLAYLYQKNVNDCRGNPRDTIVRNVWMRRKAAWREQLARTTDATQRRVLTGLLQRTFSPDGQPTAAAMQFGREDLFDRGMGAITTPERIPTIGEGMLSVHWGIRLDLGQHGFLSNGVTDTAIQADHRRNQNCQWPMMMAVQEYFQNPECPVPAGNVIPDDIRNSVEAMTRVVSRQDLRASIVGLMSPACADQAARRRITGYSCRENTLDSVNGPEMKEEVFSDLCSGRAVSLTVCRQFTKLTGPFDSGHCSRAIPGAIGDDYHALTAIGMRYAGARRQMLIQNSTGSNCPFMTDGAVRSGFGSQVECERNADGVTTGRFWIDEDLIMNNTISVTSLRKN